jgi:hypothetical protein
MDRRSFLSLMVCTPAAAALMNHQPQNSPIAILESTSRGVNDWKSSIQACDDWVRRYSGMYFTGFKQAIPHQVYSGQILWQGVATYRSGRKETVFYYVNMMITPEEALNPLALAPHVDMCLERVRQFKDQFDETGTICTVYHSHRPVAQIEWYRHGDAPYYQPVKLEYKIINNKVRKVFVTA